MIEKLCAELKVESAPHEAFAKGGAGTIELAEKTIHIVEQYKNPQKKFLYSVDMPIEEKIRTIATQMYGAKDIIISPKIRKKLDRFLEFGFGNLPVCIAKTQMSLSDDPNMIGAPKGWVLTVSDVNLSAGAGFLVAVCGNMMLMPGLPKVPAAVNMDVDDDGEITGLF
jgi:formate--tetrahydrofolate ligase